MSLAPKRKASRAIPGARSDRFAEIAARIVLEAQRLGQAVKLGGGSIVGNRGVGFTGMESAGKKKKPVFA